MSPRVLVSLLMLTVLVPVFSALAVAWKELKSNGTLFLRIRPILSGIEIGWSIGTASASRRFAPQGQPARKSRRSSLKTRSIASIVAATEQ